MSVGLIDGQPLPSRIMRAYRAFHGRWDRDDALLFGLNARPGPLAALYSDVKTVPGFFTYDDVVAFTLLLETQRICGITGDVLEIGSYHGRSTVAMARCVQPDERLIVCDTFERRVEQNYPNPANPEELRRTLSRLAPNLRQLDIRASRSDELDLDGTALRFAHIDGGHTHDIVLHDLRLVSSRLCAGGIIAVDDYQHYEWEEVTTAVDAFVSESGFNIVADVNRWAESGRKLYLSHSADIPMRQKLESSRVGQI